MKSSDVKRIFKGVEIKQAFKDVFREGRRYLRVVIDEVLQWVFPRRCPVCDGIVVPRGEKICIECLGKLKLLTAPWCMKCGKKMLHEGEFCKDCQRKEHKFIRGRALYEYDSAALSVYRFKYGGRQEYGDFYGEEIAAFLGDFIRSVRPDCLIPVPLHRKRRIARGYNQAEVLARVVGRCLEIPVCADLVVRKKNTAPLKYENAFGRQNNLKKAFIMARNDVKLKRVIIVDDIYTTGSTIDALASVLESAGIREIYFIALACGKGV